MKIIKSGGISKYKEMEILVDDDLYPFLNRFKWTISKNNRNFYAYTTIWSKPMYLHNFIMNKNRGLVVDHINRNGLDNRVENLRICTNKENLLNSKKALGKLSIYKGVTFDKERNKWRSSIAFNRKTIFLGRHDTEKEASEAYDEYAKKLHKQFARLNSSQDIGVIK